MQCVSRCGKNDTKRGHEQSWNGGGGLAGIVEVGGLKEKEDKNEEGGGTATIDAHMVGARSEEEISAVLSALFDSSMSANAK
jgi:hypothetical protein